MCGILSWIAQVYITGRPLRDAIFEALGRLRSKGPRTVQVRDNLKRQLQWWWNAMGSGAATACSYFWDKQPEIPLMCSDASGEDGWGVCVMDMHIVGSLSDEWRQSAGGSAPGMLIKELVPPVIATLLLAPFCKGKVYAAATDNAGMAFVLNSISCRCPMSLALLRPLADSLAKHHLGLISGHSYRQHNTNCLTPCHNRCGKLSPLRQPDACRRRKFRGSRHGVQGGVCSFDVFSALFRRRCARCSLKITPGQLLRFHVDFPTAIHAECHRIQSAAVRSAEAARVAAAEQQALPSGLKPKTLATYSDEWVRYVRFAERMWSSSEIPGRELPWNVFFTVEVYAI